MFFDPAMIPAGSNHPWPINQNKIIPIFGSYYYVF